MNALRLDELRFAVRRLRKDLGSTIASVVALACGIGAAVATWSLVSAVLLNPLPVFRHSWEPAPVPFPVSRKSSRPSLS